MIKFLNAAFFQFSPDPRVAFEIFGLEIYWYGIIMSFAIVTAFLTAGFFMKKVGFRNEIVYEILLIVVPLGILGARLLFLLCTPGESLTNFFNFRDGGIAIWGAILFGALGIFIYTRFVRRCSFFAVSDIVALGVILAQSIGRWGNFFNEELYGLETGFHFFPLTVMVGVTPHLALFFYESILNLIGFLILLKVFSRQKKYGTTTAVYLLIYGIVRSALELFRDPKFIMDSPGFPVSFAFAIAAIVCGIVLLILSKYDKLDQRDIALRANKET